MVGLQTDYFVIAPVIPPQCQYVTHPSIRKQFRLLGGAWTTKAGSRATLAQHRDYSTACATPSEGGTTVIARKKRMSIGSSALSIFPESAIHWTWERRRSP